MAKKTSSNGKSKTAAPKTKARTTAVRNTAVPKITQVAAATTRQITQDDIARRAYEIYLSGTGGNEADNWHRAERELRGL